MNLRYHFALLLAAVALGAVRPAFAWQLESAQVQLNNTFNNPTATRVNFRQVYDTVPVVVGLMNQRGGDPSALRVLNVSTTGFDVMQVEPTDNDGPHLDVTMHYVAVQPGNHVLPDGTRVSAGRIDTTAVQFGQGVAGVESWERINFTERFVAAPVVLAAVQTLINESNNPPANPSQPWLTVALQNAATGGVDVALERSEAGPGAVNSPETIGWIAFDADVQGTLTDNGGATVNYETQKTDARFRGWTDGCTTINFTNTYTATPRVIATKRTRFEDDGGWLRNCSINATRVGLRVDEDRDFDNERTHVPEAADMAVFAVNFDARYDPDIRVTKTALVISDPINATNPKAIPGAVVRYTLNVTNGGTGTPDRDTVELIDPIPVGTSLMVDDPNAVAFTDGTPTSELSFAYAGLANTLDDVAFSSDGGSTFSYVPTPDGRGADAAVTHLRVTPRGRFAAGASPTFDLVFRVVVD